MIGSEIIDFRANSEAKPNTDGFASFKCDRNYIASKDNGKVSIIDTVDGNVVKVCNNECEYKIWCDMLGLEVLGPEVSIVIENPDTYYNMNVKGALLARLV